MQNTNKALQKQIKYQHHLALMCSASLVAV